MTVADPVGSHHNTNCMMISDIHHHRLTGSSWHHGFPVSRTTTEHSEKSVLATSLGCWEKANSQTRLDPSVDYLIRIFHEAEPFSWWSEVTKTQMHRLGIQTGTKSGNRRWSTPKRVPRNVVHSTVHDGHRLMWWCLNSSKLFGWFSSVV